MGKKAIRVIDILAKRIENVQLLVMTIKSFIYLKSDIIVAPNDAESLTLLIIHRCGGLFFGGGHAQ